MKNKTYNIVMLTLCIIPIIVVVISYSSLPLLSVSNSLILSNFLSLNEIIENFYYLLDFFNIKNLAVLLSIIPLMFYIKNYNLIYDYDNLNRNIYIVYSYINISFYIMVCFILYASIFQLGIFQVVQVSNQFIYVSFAIYFCILAFLAKTFPLNEVVGFKNKYVTTNFEYKEVNKLYTLLMIILSAICILISIIKLNILISLPLIAVVYYLMKKICFIYSKSIYEGEHV